MLKTLTALATAAALSMTLSVAEAGAAKPSPKVAKAKHSQVKSPTPKRPSAGVIYLDAGSAGQPGYDDARCAEILRDLQTVMSQYEQAMAAHDFAAADQYSQMQDQLADFLTDHCIVIYRTANKPQHQTLAPR